MSAALIALCTSPQRRRQYRMAAMPAPSEPDESGRLYLQIADSIAAPIRSGTLVSGERIPSVRELSRRHGVSQGTVVQAYRLLEDSRLIEARSRSGYFVARAPQA